MIRWSFVNGGELGRRRRQHSGEVAKAAQQILGQRLRVATGLRLKQQYLQELVIGQRLGTGLQEFLSEPLPVAEIMGLIGHGVGIRDEIRRA